MEMNPIYCSDLGSDLEIEMVAEMEYIDNGPINLGSHDYLQISAENKKYFELDDYTIDFNQIHVIEKMASGQFGSVYKGKNFK